MLQYPRRKHWIASILLALSSAPRTVHAHHSFAMYDSTKLVVIDGTVTNFQWTNPHVLLWVTGSTSADGTATLWTIELPTRSRSISRARFY